MKAKYKMNVVNPDKNVVTLQPTAGTYVKAFVAPMVLAAIGWVIITAIESADDDAINSFKNALD